MKRKSQKPKQLSFFGREIPKVFGGSLLKGNPKTKRPLSTREAIHLVLKSKQAMGPHSMLQKRNSQHIEKTIRQTAKACAINIYHLVNVGNHLHLVIRIKDLRLYRKFIRAITGIIARHVMKKERSGGYKFIPKEFREDLEAVKRELKAELEISFWVARPFTRLIAWGKDYQHIKAYMKKNQLQANPRLYFAATGFDAPGSASISPANTG